MNLIGSWPNSYLPEMYLSVTSKADFEPAIQDILGISNDFITQYSKNVAIVLLHGGPGYGKSHVLQCMRQLNDAYNLNSLVMAFSGTAASQFEGGKTSHGSCGWNVGKRYSAFKNITDDWTKNVGTHKS